MYTIRQVAERTGFSPDTLRYYEKIRLVEPPPMRGAGGVRLYSEDDVRMLSSLHCLKKTGLSLDDIKEFIQEGRCFANHANLNDDDLHKVADRVQILAGHLEQMEQQRQELDTIIQRTKEKLDAYNAILQQADKSKP
ncbi:MerR family transcriptional regulator [Paenibacillus hodogayensis]|uniref:MerR family transcriptional regulator n=1 Tax=Paenibacillus hodogayensis TaxID=279208 RepID=A0ABV5VWR5_9BACL